ncbi:MAG: extracellular solute-binding protein [Actinobacteria bacterium]|nr:extracellular solute-binding protein [Actinomycetota bacterium]
MKKFKLFAVVASIAMVASLAVTIPARAAGITMTYLTPAYLPGTVAATERIVADWNAANPAATVKIVYGDVNNMQDKLTTAFAGNVAPDIFQHEAASILSFSKQGYLADLTKEMKTLKSTIPTGLWNVGSYKNHLYGVPTMTQTYTIYANVDMFKKAGVAVPVGTNTFTWDDYQALAKKFTTSTNYGVAWGLKSPAAMTMIMGMNFNASFFRGMSSSSGPILSVNKAELEVPSRIHAMIYDDKSVDPASLTMSGAGPVPGFLAGKYAMIFAASYVAADLDIAAKASGFNWTALPLLKGNNNQQGANPQTLSVSAQSKYPKQAAAFIRYMMADKNLSDLALGEALIPSTSGSLKTTLALKKGNVGWTQILDDGASLALAPFTLVPNYQKWKDTVLQPAMQQYIQGKISITELKSRELSGWLAIR